jgi:ribosomal protein S18 acetylase RimI-like enzyme
MIRLAKETELLEIMSITKACTSHMIDQGIYQWNDDYPSKKAFIKDINRKELFVLKINSKLIGCMVLTPVMDKEYESINWITGNNNSLYVHRLAIYPKKQGKGYAQKLMDFAENFAIGNNYNSIRLDTFSKNIKNQKFYEIRGFKRLGNIYFPKQSEFPFYCYEWLCKK